jgi:hypothetical protein
VSTLRTFKFVTPTRAWVLDFHLSGGHEHDSAHRGDSLSQGRDGLGDRESHWAYNGSFQGLSFTATVYF